jgi:hypothetical protein
MDRASELLEYYAEHPPAHVILAAVHLKPDRKQSQSRKRRAAAAASQLQELSGFLGQSAQPVPDHLRKMAEWAIAHSPRIQ